MKKVERVVAQIHVDVFLWINAVFGYFVPWAGVLISREQSPGSCSGGMLHLRKINGCFLRTACWELLCKCWVLRKLALALVQGHVPTNQQTNRPTAIPKYRVYIALYQCTFWIRAHTKLPNSHRCDVYRNNIATHTLYIL